jgi:hypothetical protein
MRDLFAIVKTVMPTGSINCSFTKRPDLLINDDGVCHYNFFHYFSSHYNPRDCDNPCQHTTGLNNTGCHCPSSKYILAGYGNNIGHRCTGLRQVPGMD